MRSKKISLGFQVVDTRTGEILSERFARRGPAREVAKSLYAQNPERPIGVQHVEEYVAR